MLLPRRARMTGKASHGKSRLRAEGGKMKPVSMLFVALLLAAAPPPPGEPVASTTTIRNAPSRTRVIVLGVNHSAQLVAEADQPAALAAYISAVAPDAICVERPPEQAARRDFYEFTYEVQGIVLPYAAKHKVELCPVDWMPPVEDEILAFGINIDEPPEIRPASDFQGFLTFPDPKALKRDLFDADRPEATAPVRQWANNPAARADRDFPRRLYLYRTFMQAQHIRAAAASHRNGTVLVVIGEFHKPDLEAILANDASIELVEPSTLPHPSPADVAAATTDGQRAAILAFNLLGRQADTGNVAWPWIGRVLSAFEASRPGAEARLFRARFDQLHRRLAPDAAAGTYRSILASTPKEVAFSWTGVKDKSRIDSYFDPFGNLSVGQRAQVELARCLFAAGKAAEAKDVLARLASELTPRQARQLDAYEIYLRPASRS
jgi:hypothetical protein